MSSLGDDRHLQVQAERSHAASAQQSVVRSDCRVPRPAPSHSQRDIPTGWAIAMTEHGGNMRGLTCHLVLVFGFLLVHQPTPAQQAAPGPVTTAFRADAGRLARNLVAAADDMPPAKYQFKPTPAQMSVAEVVLHLAGDSELGCASLGGTNVPA